MSTFYKGFYIEYITSVLSELAIQVKPFGIDQNGKVSSLQDHYQNSQDKNLMLIGEGGIGKTTFLAHLMTSIIPIDDLKVIPFYIELNCCPPEIGDWYSSRLRKTNFITRYIASVMDNRDLEDYSSDDLAELEKMLSSQQDVQFLLLLDGLNEVNVAHAAGKKAQGTIRDLLKQEISVLSQYPCVRIILTTRAMSDGYFPEGFRNIRIKGLEDEKIRQYLRHNRFTETDIKWISVNRSLMDCLRVPLFLCMFACRNQYESVHPTAKGEILYHFFHRGTPFYSEKRKYKELFASNQSERKYLAFIEDFLLPAMAYDMYIRGDFQLSKKRMSKCLNDAIKDPLMEYAAETSGFTDYEMEPSTLKDVYESVKQTSREDILTRCVDVLGILYSSVGNGLVRYGFIHHHIRDYFAAYYIVQRIRCALYFYAEKKDEDPECGLDQDADLYLSVRGALEPVFYEKLDKNLQRFVGEILGEHRNVLRLEDQKRWIPAEKVFDEQDTLENVLGMFRYQKAEPRNTIDNVIEILKTVRSSLGNMVFDGLDLRNCCLYETICSSGIDNLKVSASFRDCIVSNQTFWFRGHLGNFRDVKVSTNNSLLYTYGDDDQVCVWEISSMHRKLHFSTSNAIYHEGHSPYKEKIVVGSTNEFLIACYDEEYIDGKVTAVRSAIDCYTLTGQVMHLSEEGEKREIACMNFSCDGTILGVWGNDTLRIFDSENGRLLKKARFDIKGDVTGVFLSAGGRIILQTKMREKQDTASVIVSGTWALYELDPETGSMDVILQYETAKNVMYGERLPAFAADQNGRVYFYFSDERIHLFDMVLKTDKAVWRFEDGTVPARIKILNQDTLTIAVQWHDRILYLSEEGQQSVLYENSLLSDAEIFEITNNKAFFVNNEGKLTQWDLNTDHIAEDIIPRIRLEIEDLQQDRAGHIMVRYSNSCILTVDTAKGILLDTFFSNENDAVLEASLFLEAINRQLIVLRTPEYEQLLLYDNHSGVIQRVDVYAFEQLTFVTAKAYGNILFIGFDRKVIALDLLTEKQAEVWRQHGGEILFDMEAGPDTAALLLQWKILCRRPVYKVYSGSVEAGFEETGVRNADFIDFRLAKDLMVEKGNDYVYYGMDALSGQPIYTVKGILRGGEEADSKRQFMLVKSTMEFSGFLYQENETTFVTQSDSDWLVTVTDYSHIRMVKRRSGEETVLQIKALDNREDSLNIADALVCGNHKIFCTTVEDKVIQADAWTGLLEKRFDFMPGIIVSGCDFTGSQMSENTKKVLIQHGAVFH